MWLTDTSVSWTISEGTWSADLDAASNEPSRTDEETTRCPQFYVSSEIPAEAIRKVNELQRLDKIMQPEPTPVQRQ